MRLDFIFETESLTGNGGLAVKISLSFQEPQGYLQSPLPERWSYKHGYHAHLFTWSLGITVGFPNCRASTSPAK